MRVNKWAWGIPGLIVAQFVANPSALAAWELNFKPGVTDISRSVYDLHMLIFYICIAISVVVFGVMFWSIFHHRKSRGAQAYYFHENTAVEIAWTVVPLLILVGMAVPASKTLIDMYDSSEAELDVKITGYQWKWHYDYIEHDVAFFSNLTTSDESIRNQAEKSENYLLEVDNRLVIPEDTKVRFLLTANDVIHSWWVSDLAVKRDAIPGFINEAWTKVDEPGIYRGQCTELCGVYHGFMPVVVEVKTKEDFQQWLADAKSAQQAEAASATKDWSMEELMVQGETVYKTACAACHQVNGAGIPGAFPGLKDSPVALGDINKHIDVVVNGVPKTAMQAFGNQLSAVDLAAVITYERNAWGNDKGDKVTPQQIQQLMEQ